MADELLRGAVHHRELSGLSGDRVVLLTTDGETWFVRKGSRDAARSARLREQVRRQQAFGAVRPGGLGTPAVLAEDEVDGRYHVDMQYVPGLDGATYLQDAEVAAVRGFGDRIEGVLAALAAAPTDAVDPIDLYDCLVRRVAAAHRRTPVLDDADLGRLLQVVEPVRDLRPLAPTLNHGDLTLENLIVDGDGELWAVDLLDGPADHWWFDVAKLHQDLTGGWYQRRVGPLSRAVLAYLGERLVDVACGLDPAYRAAHMPILVTSFVRILPYAATDHDRAMVVERIRHLTTLALGRESVR